MTALKETLKQKIEEHRPRTMRLLKEYADVKVGEVTIGQVIGGARGVKCLVTDISYLDPEEGIRFRGKTIPETFAALPKVPGSDYPYVEGFVYFLLTGDIPTEEQTLEVVEDLRARSRLPQYCINILEVMPQDEHPMTLLSAAIVTLQRESVFVKRYQEGMSKMDYWDPMYEDCMNLLAKLPAIGAHIYRMKYKDHDQIPADPNLDFGGNFARQMGIDPPYDDVARMYFILHSDHESGNVSAHTTHLVASALSDCYYALAAGIDGLGKAGSVGHAERGPGDPRIRPRRVAQDRSALYGPARVLPEAPARLPAVQADQHDLQGRAGHLDRAGQGQEPLAQRGRPVRRHPVVLRHHGVGLLYRAVRHRPRHRRAVEHHLGSRSRLRDRASEVRDDRDAGEGRRRRSTRNGRRAEIAATLVSRTGD